MESLIVCAALMYLMCLMCSSVYLSSSDSKVVSVTFLLTVNDTWYPVEYNKTCLQTVKTPPIQPNMSWNKSLNIKVGKCDHGPLTFQIFEQRDEKMERHTYLNITFYSHVIEDAMPPTCNILWDYQYREPTSYGANESLLPGCFVMDSREGWYLTYYWFHVLDWVVT